jgi:hypothetical protein
MFNFLKKLFGPKPAPADLPAKGFYGTIPPRPMPPPNPWPPVPEPGFVRAEQSRQKRREDELALRRMERAPHTPVPRAAPLSVQQFGRATRYSPVAAPAPRPYDDTADMMSPSNPLSPLNPINHVVYSPMVSADPVTHYDPPAPSYSPPPDYSCPAPSPSYDPPACSPPPMDFGSPSPSPDSSGW